VLDGDARVVERRPFGAQLVKSQSETV